MKRTLSILLALAMLLASCTLLISCSKISEKDVEKDPYTALGTAWQETTKEFFPTDKKAAKMMEQANKFTLRFDSGTIPSEAPIKGEIIFYGNAADPQSGYAVTDLSLSLAEMADIDARLYLNREMIAFTFPALLGNEDALGLYYKSLAEDIEGSVFAEVLGLDAVVIAQLQETFSEVFAMSKDTEATEAVDFEAFFEKILETFKMSVSTEEIDGEEYVTVDLVLNNETLTAFSTYIKSEPLAAAGIDLSFDVDELLEPATIDLAAKICIAPKEGRIEQIKLDGSMTAEEEQVSLSSYLKFTEDEILLHIEGNADEEAFFADIVLAKQETKQETVYTLTVTGGTNNVTAKVLDATFTKKTDGSFALNVEIIEDENDTTTFGLKGKYTSTETMVSLSLTEATIDDETHTFELTIAAETDSEVPPMTENAKDLINMTAEEWMTLLRDMMSSELGALIFGMGGGSTATDYEKGYWDGANDGYNSGYYDGYEGNFAGENPEEITLSMAVTDEYEQGYVDGWHDNYAAGYYDGEGEAEAEVEAN